MTKTRMVLLVILEMTSGFLGGLVFGRFHQTPTEVFTTKTLKAH